MSNLVQYPIAHDKEGRWVNIANAIRTSEYYCPECKSPFVVRLGEIRKHHFAHRPGYSGECTGESGYHNLAKHMLAYQFEHEGKILLTYTCPHCRRTETVQKTIRLVQVEKGEQEHRPDVRLVLDGDEVIECEVVYKNPLGNKFKTSREQRLNLLVWNIRGQVDKVPPLVQCHWDDMSEIPSTVRKRGDHDSIYLYSSLLIKNHACRPYGIAYICQTECYKCRQKTKIAILSFWYPMWGEDNQKPGGITDLDGIHIERREYVRSSDIPKAFVEKLNQQCGTRLSADHSHTVRETYVMNHCEKCEAKIGDYYLFDLILDSVVIQKVIIEFDLTPWELKRIKDSETAIGLGHKLKPNASI